MNFTRYTLPVGIAIEKALRDTAQNLGGLEAKLSALASDTDEDLVELEEGRP